jgi:hypothetical protein
MKRKRLLKIATLSIIMLLSLTLTAFAANTSTLTVEPNIISTLRWSLTEGTTLKGSVALNGTLWFYATDPHANKIFDFGFISQSASFNFTTTVAGDYTLFFDNSGGSTSKSVTVSYDIAAPLSLLVVVPLIVFAASSIGLIVFVYWYHKKSKSNS